MGYSSGTDVFFLVTEMFFFLPSSLSHPNTYAHISVRLTEAHGNTAANQNSLRCLLINETAAEAAG